MDEKTQTVSDTVQNEDHSDCALPLPTHLQVIYTRLLLSSNRQSTAHLERRLMFRDFFVRFLHLSIRKSFSALEKFLCISCFCAFVSCYGLVLWLPLSVQLTAEKDFQTVAV